MKPTSLLKNAFGPLISRRLLAIFVDDFGSIRVKDKSSLKQLLKQGVKDSLYLRDTLASEMDLEALFETLYSVRDCHNRPVRVTPFAIMANPDFDKIRNSAFYQYYRESFVDTFKRYGNGYEHAYDLWKQGQTEGIFMPAFHGTEHMNVKKWMNALRNGHQSTILGFDNECVCIPCMDGEDAIDGMVKECDIESKSDLDSLFEDIRIGAAMFREYIGEEPSLFTPGAGTYSPLFEPCLLKCGIKYLDIARSNVQPLGDGKFTKQYHYLGQKNKLGLRFIVRNCSFEPVKGGDNVIATCFDQIACAFAMHKPAIISTHRLNYIGHFDESNRTENLGRLKTLLEMVKKRWPDVEFVSGKEICDLYK